jgi:hypothetical protein
MRRNDEKQGLKAIEQQDKVEQKKGTVKFRSFEATKDA